MSEANAPVEVYRWTRPESMNTYRILRHESPGTMNGYALEVQRLRRAESEGDGDDEIWDEFEQTGPIIALTCELMRMQKGVGAAIEALCSMQRKPGRFPAGPHDHDRGEGDER